MFYQNNGIMSTNPTYIRVQAVSQSILGILIIKTTTIWVLTICFPNEINLMYSSRRYLFIIEFNFKIFNQFPQNFVKGNERKQEKHKLLNLLN